MRGKFDVQLMELKKKIVTMSGLVNKAIDQAVLSLKERDLELAEKIIADDEVINNMEREIEQLRSVPPRLNPYYIKEVNNYFKRLRNTPIN